MAATTALPVNADLENGFSDDPAGVAATVAAAVEAGVAGCSIEDFTGDPADPIYDPGLARERVDAAAGVARISVGGWFSLAAIGAVTEMAREFRTAGVIGLPSLVQTGREARDDAFTGERP